MTDATDGSSSAAQRAQGQAQAQDPTAEARTPGLFGRLAQAFKSEESTDADIGDAANGAASRDVPHGLVNLHRLRVEDVSIPRADIVSVASDITKSDLLDVFRESGLSRLPVFKGTMDTPLGLVHLKDFALEYGFNGSKGTFSLKKLVRPLLYAPPSMPIGVLMQKMQAERIHMALVIDEYGGVDGLITLEDLIEQVLGEIEDEHDIDEDNLWTLERPGVWLVEARAPLDEFEAESGLVLHDPAEEEIDTLGGIVFVMLGRVPTRGEVIPHPSGAEFEIVDADPRRVKRLRVCRPDALKTNT